MDAYSAGQKEACIGQGNPSLDTDPMRPSLEDRLDEIRVLLERMLELAEVSAEPGTLAAERQALQEELECLRSRIDQAADGKEPRG